MFVAFVIVFVLLVWVIAAITFTLNLLGEKNRKPKWYDGIMMGPILLILYLVD